MKKVTLQPVAMIKPTKDFVYSPSRLSPKKTIDEAEFLEKYADYPYNLNVDGQKTTAYGRGLDCWYIVTDS